MNTSLKVHAWHAHMYMWRTCSSPVHTRKHARSQRSCSRNTFYIGKHIRLKNTFYLSEHILCKRTHSIKDNHIRLKNTFYILSKASTRALGTPRSFCLLNIRAHIRLQNTFYINTCYTRQMHALMNINTFYTRQTHALLAYRQLLPLREALPTFHIFLFHIITKVSPPNS